MLQTATLAAKARLAFGIITCILWWNVSDAQPFVNRTNFYGLNAHCDGLYGNGVSFFDWDYDGWDDITVCNDSDPIQFFWNNHGILQEVQFNGIDPEGRVRTISWVDFDNDGDADLSMNQEQGIFRLYENQGDFQFVDISSQAGFITTTCNGYGHCWGDYNRDGFLDVYVTNYVTDPAPAACTNHLYKNNGNGTFTNVTLDAGVGNGIKLTYIAVWVDYNHDQWPDLFVENDRVLYQNYMYRNNGDGTFSDVSAAAGLNHFFDPMSGTVADYNNDGYPDIYVTDTYDNRMYLHNGDSSYTDVAGLLGVQAHMPCWGSMFIDGNLDGQKDLVVATSNPMLTINALYLYQNSGTGFEMNLNSGFDGVPGKAYAVAHGDINRDGKPDVLAHLMAPHNSMLWENTTSSGNYIRLRLEGSSSNRDGIGSRVIVGSGGQLQYFFPMCGEQYLAQNSQWMICGLGAATRVDSVVVEWPSGQRDVFRNLIAGRDHVLPEGQSIPLPDFSNLPSFHCVGDTVVWSAPGWDHWAWSDGSSDSTLVITTSGSYAAEFAYQGYSVWMPPVDVNFEPIPNYAVLFESPACHNAASGTILGIANHPELFQGVLDSNTVFFPVEGLLAGTYPLRIESEGACPFETEVILTNPDSLAIQLNLSASSECEDAVLVEGLVSGGSGNYSWWWTAQHLGSVLPFAISNLSEEFCVPITSASIVRLEITDSLHCEAAAEVLIQPEGLANTNKLAISAAPNPFSDQLQLQLPEQCRVELRNALGEVVYAAYLNEGKHSMVTDHLAKGYYVLHVQNGQTHRVISLIHQP